MADEIKIWLVKHIEDLQEALREVCENEHSYHYTPPGFHVDQTAVDLRVFKKLSEKFELVVIQMVGTFDTFVDNVNTRMETIISVWGAIVISAKLKLDTFDSAILNEQDTPRREVTKQCNIVSFMGNRNE